MLILSGERNEREDGQTADVTSDSWVMIGSLVVPSSGPSDKLHKLAAQRIEEAGVGDWAALCSHLARLWRESQMQSCT